MSLSSFISLLLIAAGATVMAVCIRRFGPAVRQLKRVSEKEYIKIKALADFNRALMAFFLVGYLAVALSIVLQVRIIGEYFVGAVFFFGAVFVLLGIVLQSKMTASLKYRFEAAIGAKEALEAERKNLSAVNERLNAEITERLQAEKALTSAKAFLQNIIDSMPEQLEPYFTTKVKGEGTGLGLYVVHGIVQQFNGYMDVTSIPGQGTTFAIYFPQTEAAPGTIVSAAHVHPTGRETVLLVDDDSFIVEMTAEILTGLGYRVFPVTSAAEALKVFEKVPDRFDLVITDQTMPEMTGDKLVHCLRQIKPRLPAIVCTGYSENLDSDKARESGINAFLMKPVERRVLAQTVRRVLDDSRISFELPRGASINPETASAPNAASATAAACGLAGQGGCP